MPAVRPSRRWRRRSRTWRRAASVCVCGRGNNGGDGFVVARTLVQRGVDTSVFLLGSVADVRGDARTNLEMLGRIGMTVVEISERAGVGAALQRALGVRARRRRDPRHRLPRTADRAARDRRRRCQRPRHSDRRDRSADGRVGRQRTTLDGTGRRGVDDGHARRAEDSAGLSAGRHARGRPGDRRHRHSAAAARRARRAASRAADARADARDRAGAHAPTRTRGTSAGC